MSNIEQTLSIIKPDAVERNLSDEIKNEFNKKILKLLKKKKLSSKNQMLKSFIKFINLSHFIMIYVIIFRRPYCCNDSRKENAVLENRKLMGATDPSKAEEGTLRKKYGLSIDKNSVHGSDSVENAKIEIDFFLVNRK